MSGPERISAFGKLQREHSRSAETTIIRPVTSVHDEIPFTNGHSQAIRSVLSQSSPLLAEAAPRLPSRELVDIAAERESIMQKILAEEAGKTPTATKLSSEGIFFQLTIQGNAEAADLLRNGQLPVAGLPAMVHHAEVGRSALATQLPDDGYDPEASSYFDGFDELIVGPKRNQPKPRSHLSPEANHRLRLAAAWAGTIGLLAFTGTHISEVGAAYYQMYYEHKPDLPKMLAAYRGLDPNAQPAVPASGATSPTNLPSLEPSPNVTQGATP